MSVANIKVKLKPFTVPNYVVEHKGFGEKDRTFDLSEIEEHVLEIMCNDFKNKIMQKAGYSSKSNEEV